MIGCGELAAVQILPEVIETFHKKYPLASYDIFTATADLVKEQMEKGLIDLGVLLEPIDMEKFDFIRLAGKERWVVLMRPDDPLADKEAISAKVLFTSNLSTNGVLMVQRGLAYSIAIEGSVPFWDKEKIVYRPLYPELTANSVLVWKKQQPFTLAADKFIEHLKCFLDMSEV